MKVVIQKSAERRRQEQRVLDDLEALLAELSTLPPRPAAAQAVPRLR